ncbi:MAG: LysM peptidoglycan-binding domain-containing protein [Nitrospiraceae bacterium]
MRMTTGKTLYLSAICCGGLLMAGCVMNEKYEAEKARALNFQRLLAQEEKRTGELDAELKRLKRETPELDARNRELTAQLDAVREQMGRIQDESAALREAAALKAKEELHRSLQPKSRPPSAPKASVPKNEKADMNDMFRNDLMMKGEVGAPLLHEVKPGETLFSLARQYGVEVKQIKEWNRLRDNLIEVGRKLVVGYP